VHRRCARRFRLKIQNYLIHTYKSSANLFINHWSHIKWLFLYFRLYRRSTLNASYIF
jgi:hypothetical protein